MGQKSLPVLQGECISSKCVGPAYGKENCCNFTNWRVDKVAGLETKDTDF